MWTALFSLSGGGCVCPLLVKDLMLGWLRLPLRKKDLKLWRAVPLYLIWAIWKERNRVVFEDDGFSRTRLKKNLSSWASLIHDVEHSFVRDVLCIP